MHADVTPSVEISIAMLSWINEQLRTSLPEPHAEGFHLPMDWIQNTVTVLSVFLSGFGLLALQRMV